MTQPEEPIQRVKGKIMVRGRRKHIWPEDKSQERQFLRDAIEDLQARVEKLESLFNPIGGISEKRPPLQ